MDLGEGQKDMGSGAQPNVWDQNVISKEGVKGGKWKPGTTGTVFQPERKKNY